MKVSFKKAIKRMSVFDLMSLLIVGLVLISIFLFFFRSTNYTMVRIRITGGNILWSGNNPKSEYARLFRPGMKKNDGLGRLEAEVIKTDIFDVSTNEKVVFLDLKLRTLVNKRTNQLTFGGAPVLVGAPLKVELEDILAEGLVTDIAGVNSHQESADLLVKTRLEWKENEFPGSRGAPKYVIDAVHVGDKVFDQDGNQIIEVVGKRAKKAEMVTVDQWGRPVLTTDPLKYDLELDLKVRTKKLDDEYWIRDAVRVSIGAAVPLSLPKITLYPVNESFDLASGQ